MSRTRRTRYAVMQVRDELPEEGESASAGCTVLNKCDLVPTWITSPFTPPPSTPSEMVSLTQLLRQFSNSSAIPAQQFTSHRLATKATNVVLHQFVGDQGSPFSFPFHTPSLDSIDSRSSYTSHLCDGSTSSTVLVSSLYRQKILTDRRDFARYRPS
ncbi:hypothetical protein FRC12_002000 [Ceratobasidium sp. 428]|nr:hypothetical protein FRC12_002000 [Ceratobasidium sp. 428]